jgi:lysophospholipase L1-like esterase
MDSSRRRLLLGGAALTSTWLPGCTGLPARETGPWLAAWGSAQLEQPANEAPSLQGMSLRQIVQTTVAGSAVRVRFSNLFGREPLRIDAAGLARVAPNRAPDAAPTLLADSLRPLRFDGRRELALAPGAEAWSDPVALALPRLAELAIQMHIAAAPAGVTAHPGSRIASWLSADNRVDTLAWPDAVARVGWWHLAAADVKATHEQPVLVAIGDSITDGYGVPSGSYRRWTDALARRLAASGREAAVINTGIGGNRLLRDGLGPSVMARFERDVLARTGVTHAVLLAGVNDLGTSHRQRATTPESRQALLNELAAGLSMLERRAAAHGICLLVGTVMPYGGSGYYQPGPENEADRQQLDAFIRRPGGFDGVLDFDALMRDPARPSHLKRELDNDGLHPSMAGYQAMADAFPLDWLDRRCPVSRTIRVGGEK